MVQASLYAASPVKDGGSELQPILAALQKHAGDPEGVSVMLDALQTIVANGDAEDEMEEEELLPVVLTALNSHPGSAEVASAGYAVLSSVALRSENPKLAVAGTDAEAIARFYAWKEEKRRQRENLKRIMARFRNAAAAAAFGTWYETTQQILGIKRLVSGLLHRELASALQQWVRGAAALRGERRSTRLHDAEGAKARGDWIEVIRAADDVLMLGERLLALGEEEAYRAPLGVEGVADAAEELGGGGVDAAVVREAAERLKRDAAVGAEEQERQDKANRLKNFVNRLRNAEIAGAWDGWMEYHRRIELCKRVASRIVLRALHMCFDGWALHAEQMRESRKLMARVAKTLLNTRMARAYKRWLGYMAELEEERARQRAVAEAERLRRKEAFLLKQLFRNL